LDYFSFPSPNPIFALIDAARLAEAASNEAIDRLIAMHDADPALDAAQEKPMRFVALLATRKMLH
jgi:hypothetical protein